MSPRVVRLLPSCLIAAAVAAQGCNGRPEGDIPAPRPASQKEMDDSEKAVADSLRQMERNGLTTAKTSRLTPTPVRGEGRDRGR
jgi:hypothetical protein